MKLALSDMYARGLKEEARRKRVARDYKLFSQYFKLSKRLGQRKGGTGGPSLELVDSLKPFSQYTTYKEFQNMVDNFCFEKELKVRIKELLKFRENGLTKARHLGKDSIYF